MKDKRRRRNSIKITNKREKSSKVTETAGRNKSGGRCGPIAKMRNINEINPFRRLMQPKNGQKPFTNWDAKTANIRNPEKLSLVDLKNGSVRNNEEENEKQYDMP